MTKDDVICIASKAGLTVGTNMSGIALVGSPAEIGIAHITLDEMHHFADIVETAEREECAKVCDEQEKRSRESSEKARRERDQFMYHHCAVTAKWNAAAIRARSNHD